MRIVEKRYYESSDGMVKGTFREVSEYENRRWVNGFEVKRLYCTNRWIDGNYYIHSSKYSHAYDDESRRKTDEMFIEYIENGGKYAIVSKDRVITEWVDNIGLYSVIYHPWYDAIGFGVYVHKGNEFGILYGSKSKRVLDSLRDIEYVGEWDEHGLPLYESALCERMRHDVHYQMFWGSCIDWLVDETIILDEWTRLVPRFEITPTIQCGYYLEVMYEKVLTKDDYGHKSDDSFVRRKYYVIRNRPKPKEVTLDSIRRDVMLGRIWREYDTVGDFLGKWNSSSEKERAVLRDGLGYCI